jgi:hypothetical protein
MWGRTGRLAAAAAIVVVAGSVLVGCAGGGAAAPATVTATSTVTATPSAVAATASPDDPLDALSAWTACSVAAQRDYVSEHPGSAVVAYDPSHAPEKQPDGSLRTIVGITPPPGTDGGIIASCDLTGTRGNPTLVNFTLKDI